VQKIGTIWVQFKHTMLQRGGDKMFSKKKRHKSKPELKQIKELACLPTYRWFIGGSS